MNLQLASTAAARTHARYDPGQIAARLAAAGETLAALPGTGCRPRGFHALWPDLVAGPGNAGDAADAPRRSPPSPAAITAMDETLAWVELLDSDLVRDRKIVLLRTLRWSWARIGQHVGMSGEGARQAHAWALRQIAAALNKRAVTCDA